jgi:uncharacterized C2H2 Zn-finger protein
VTLKKGLRRLRGVDVRRRCDRCGEVFPMRRDLIRHNNEVHRAKVVTFHNDGLHVCGICKATLISSCATRHHMLAMHQVRGGRVEDGVLLPRGARKEQAERKKRSVNL